MTRYGDFSVTYFLRPEKTLCFNTFYAVFNLTIQQIRTICAFYMRQDIQEWTK